MGRGIHGFLNALLSKIKHKSQGSTTRKPFMGLLTICAECHKEPNWSYNTYRLDQVIKRTRGISILCLSDKEVEEAISSEVIIIMEGILMDVIKTVGVDGRCKDWGILRPLFYVDATL